VKRLLFRRRIILGYFYSVLCSSLVFTLTLNFLDTGGPRELDSSIVIIYTFISILIFMYTVLPSVFYIMVCEASARQNVLYYVVFSSGLGYLLFPLLTQRLDQETLTQSLFLVPAGIVAGGIYWFFSGRFAGENKTDDKEQIKTFD